MTTTQIILHQNSHDDTDRYDVYDLDGDTFTSFDQLTFVETIDALPVAFKHNDPTEGARWVFDDSDAEQIRAEDPSLLVPVERINEDEPGNADYDATYRV